MPKPVSPQWAPSLAQTMWGLAVEAESGDMAPLFEMGGETSAARGRAEPSQECVAVAAPASSSLKPHFHARVRRGDLALEHLCAQP